jgi:hypothetical protein
MANAGNPEFYEALQHRVRVLEVENTRLNAEVLRLLEQLAICREKYGPNCCIRKPRTVVSTAISPFLSMPLAGFSPISWTTC